MATHSVGNSIIQGISLSPEMEQAAKNRARKLGFRSFSAYVQQLIRKDLNAGSELVLEEQKISIPPMIPSDDKTGQIGIAISDRQAISDKMTANQPLTKAEVMFWCNWSEKMFYKYTARFHGRDYLNFRKSRVLPSELNRFLSAKKDF